MGPTNWSDMNWTRDWCDACISLCGQKKLSKLLKINFTSWPGFLTTGMTNASKWVWDGYAGGHFLQVCSSRVTRVRDAWPLWVRHELGDETWHQTEPANTRTKYVWLRVKSTNDDKVRIMHTHHHRHLRWVLSSRFHWTDFLAATHREWSRPRKRKFAGWLGRWGHEKLRLRI